MSADRQNFLPTLVETSCQLRYTQNILSELKVSLAPDQPDSINP
jgi:hypothetical protein